MCGKENPWKYFCSRRISIHSCLETQIGCLLTQILHKLAFLQTCPPFYGELSIQENIVKRDRLFYLLNYLCSPFISVISPPFPCFLWLSLISEPFSFRCSFRGGGRTIRWTSFAKHTFQSDSRHSSRPFNEII